MARAMPSAVQHAPPRDRRASGRMVVRQGEPARIRSSLPSGALYVSTVDDQGSVLGLDVAGPGDVRGRDRPAVPARATARALGACRSRPRAIGGLTALLDAREQRLAPSPASWRGSTSRVGCTIDSTTWLGRFGDRSPVAPWSRWDSPRRARAPVRHLSGDRPTGRCGRWSPRAAVAGHRTRAVRGAVGSGFRRACGAAALLQHHQAAGAAVAGASLHRLPAPLAGSRSRHRPRGVVARPFCAARPSLSNFSRCANTDRPASSCTSGG